MGNLSNTVTYLHSSNLLLTSLLLDTAEGLQLALPE
jgi:hypothetical protein